MHSVHLNAQNKNWRKNILNIKDTDILLKICLIGKCFSLTNILYGIKNPIL